MSFCSLLTDKGIVEIIKSSNFKKLSDLFIKCLKLTDTTILYIANSSQLLLNSLSIYKCYNCSEDSLVKLAQSPILHSIRYLDFSSTLFGNAALAALS